MLHGANFFLGTYVQTDSQGGSTDVADVCVAVWGMMANTDLFRIYLSSETALERGVAN